MKKMIADKSASIRAKLTNLAKAEELILMRG